MGYITTKGNHKSIVLLCYLLNTTIACWSYLYVPDYWYGTSIAREEYGEVRITPVAGEVVSQYVAFEQPFNEKPFVTLNPQTSTPNNVRVNAGTISNTGFYIYAWRNTDTNITASWMAKGF